MIIQAGEKVHIMYRALYEGSTRRHVVGQVTAAEGSVCRIEGFVFIYDQHASTFARKLNMRTTIIDVAESGYVVNIIDPETVLDKVEYRYTSGAGVIVTDGGKFSLNVNEFGARS